jgi:glycosyltransferase involved in cell wall biosynthesis
MKIGLFPDPLLNWNWNWQGGRDFFAMFFDSLSTTSEPDDEIQILSISKRDTRLWQVARVAKHLVTKFPPDLNWVKKELTRPTRAFVIAGIVGRKANIQVLSELNFGALKNGFSPDVMGPWHGLKPPGIHTPCVGYIPDCQHRRMPNFFSAEEVVARDTMFAGMLRELPVVIVTSLDARNDLLRYFPNMSSEIVTLPFAASPLPGWLRVEGVFGRDKYRLPLKYFLCSNQFWQHKNHGLVVEALALARAEGRPISMVFTGAMEDYRAPSYVSQLMSRVRDLGVARDCFFLGLVPKRDQISIMKSALAVVQPTLFEGTPGGLAVYDAISVGRPVIVSDIPVNREIEKYVDAFFNPSDPASLLQAMRRIESIPQQNKTATLLLAEGRARRKHCGAVIRSAFALAMKRSMAANRTDCNRATR